VFERNDVDESTVYPAIWNFAFYASVVCRSSKLLQSLASVSNDCLTSSTTTGPASDLQLVNVFRDLSLRGFRFDDISASKTLETAASHSAHSDTESHSRIYAPLIRLLASLWKSEEELNISLFDMLVQHKAYYSKSRERQGDWYGNVSLGATAAAVLALDRGFRLRVESDYLLNLML